MTTIAFKDGIMAADSQLTDDYSDYRLTDCTKIHRCLHGGALIGQSGADDIRDVINLFEDLGPIEGNQMPTSADLAELEVDFVGLVALQDNSLWHVCIEAKEINADFYWDGSIREIKQKIASVGSGSHFALGAMEAGATAEESVSIAAKYDIYTSGPIQIEKVNY